MHILILRGMQASGKSTFAREFQAEHPDYKIVSLDSFRKMFGVYTLANDSTLVVEAYMRTIEICFENNHNLILDNMHLNEGYLRNFKDRLHELADRYKREIIIEERWFKVSLREAILRDSMREFSLGEKVLTKTYYKYIAPKEQLALAKRNVEATEAYNWKALPEALIVDIDGTLSFNDTGRSYYTIGPELLNDAPNTRLFAILKVLSSKYNLLVVSGRDAAARDVTQQWLERFFGDIKFSLYMRPEGDSRPDTEVKAEIYHEFIEPHYKVAGVIDDRKKVLRMWQDLGLYTFDVSQDAYGEIDF